MVDNIVGRVLRRMGIENDLYMHWEGIGKQAPRHSGHVALREEESQEQDEGAGVDELWALPAMTLATVGEGGEPHAATVYFAADDVHQNLYFFSAPGSQHSLDLSANPRVAATIHPLVEGWREIRGLQLRGEAHPIPLGAEWERAWARYLVKFPFTGELQGVIASKTARNTLYTFRPDWVRWIDNRRGFGHKEEWTPE
jgi:uncharacterized protein YhbP (UPF0306 family)